MRARTILLAGTPMGPHCQCRAEPAKACEASPEEEGEARSRWLYRDGP